MNIVGVTACTTGIAHTYMAAESLEAKSKELGHNIKVETQGTSGRENILTKEDIDNADIIILATEKQIDISRFEGKKVLNAKPAEAIKNPEELINKAMNESNLTLIGEQSKTESDEGTGSSDSGILGHVMSGVSFMLPIVVAGGILMAISFAFDLNAGDNEGTICWALNTLGGIGFSMMVPIMSAFIAYSISKENKAGFAAGVIGGLLSDTIGIGFIGGIIAAIIAGYTTLLLNKYLKFPRSLNGLKQILVVPVLASAITGLVIIFLIGGPIESLVLMLNDLLLSLSGGSTIILSLIFGLFYFDLGGPISKIIYAFALGAFSEGNYGPMGAAMVVGMVPPLGIALATFIRSKVFSKAEQESGRAALILGASFITEGAIPFAASNPLAVLPASVAGSAVGALVAFLLGLEIRAPHGGLFLLLIPNAVSSAVSFFIALAAGTIVTAVVMLTVINFQGRNVKKTSLEL